MTSTLRLQDVAVRIGSAQLLDGISLDVPAGRIVAVVGPNGAGKTTLLDAISGVIRPTAGSVAIDGSSNGERLSNIGRVFQGSPLPETLTVAEVAALVTKSRGEASRLLSRFGLAPHASSFVAELSTGMRRILDLAIATIGEPGVLLLDEPASGLAQSEIEYLADIVKEWRDQTGAVVLIVEHDAWLVKALADEVVVMDAGKIVAQGTAAKVLSGVRPRAQPRIHSTRDERFRAALDRVAADAVPAAALPKRTLSKWTLLRLGLREMSAGMASVLILGVLSRVLKTDLKVALGVVTAVLASYNLAAPVAVAIGHRSDTRPIFGRRRTPYILAGAVVTGLCVAAAPHVAGRLAGGVTAQAVVFSVLLFIAMGIGMYGAGTAFFALLTDRCGPAERGHAASVVYLELMVGVLLGVALTGVVVKEGATNLGTLFGLAGLLVVVLSTIAVWGQDTPIEEAPEGAHVQHVSLRTALREVAAMRQARFFFAFMVMTTLFIFLQQAVLTPFGGDVLHLSVRGSSSFSAMLTIGTIAGMVIAGRPFAEQYGHRKIAAVGLAGSVVAFSVLATAAATRSAPPAWLSILFLGFTGGIFNVSSLALMFGMSDRRRAALFMGAWTFAHAVADGAATAGGGAVYEVARRIFDSVPGGYAGVFGLEAIGLALCLPLLRVIDPERFAREAAGPPALLAEAALAGAEGAALILEADAEPEPVPEPQAAPKPRARRTPAKKTRSARTPPRARAAATRRTPAKKRSRPR
jgi:BCD family chlorophyll transporter-like MFS transporter